MADPYTQGMPGNSTPSSQDPTTFNRLTGQVLRQGAESPKLMSADPVVQYRTTQATQASGVRRYSNTGERQQANDPPLSKQQFRYGGKPVPSTASLVQQATPPASFSAPPGGVSPPASLMAPPAGSSDQAGGDPLLDSLSELSHIKEVSGVSDDLDEQKAAARMMRGKAQPSRYTSSGSAVAADTNGGVALTVEEFQARLEAERGVFEQTMQKILAAQVQSLRELVDGEVCMMRGSITELSSSWDERFRQYEANSGTASGQMMGADFRSEIQKVSEQMASIAEQCEAAQQQAEEHRLRIESAVLDMQGEIFGSETEAGFKPGMVHQLDAVASKCGADPQERFGPEEACFKHAHEEQQITSLVEAANADLHNRMKEIEVALVSQVDKKPDTPGGATLQQLQAESIARHQQHSAFKSQIEVMQQDILRMKEALSKVENSKGGSAAQSGDSQEFQSQSRLMQASIEQVSEKVQGTEIMFRNEVARVEKAYRTLMEDGLMNRLGSLESSIMTAEAKLQNIEEAKFGARLSMIEKAWQIRDVSLGQLEERVNGQVNMIISQSQQLDSKASARGRIDYLQPREQQPIMVSSAQGFQAEDAEVKLQEVANGLEQEIQMRCYNIAAVETRIQVEIAEVLKNMALHVGDLHDLIALVMGPSTLRITIETATGLHPQSYGLPSFDAFVQIEILGKEHAKSQTSVRVNAASPVWNEEHEIADCSLSDTLRFSIFAKAQYPAQTDTLLGQAELSSKEVLAVHGFNGDLRLRDVLGQSVDGVLRVRVLRTAASSTQGFSLGDNMPQWAVAMEERVSGRAYDAKASAEMSASLVQALKEQLERRGPEVGSVNLPPTATRMSSNVVRLDGETVFRTAPAQGLREGGAYLGRLGGSGSY